MTLIDMITDYDIKIPFSSSHFNENSGPGPLFKIIGSVSDHSLVFLVLLGLVVCHSRILEHLNLVQFLFKSNF